MKKLSIVPSAVSICLAALLTATGAPQEPNAPSPAAQTFPLGDVKLLDSPFRTAMERNADYLLSLDADRLLHNTRLYAGLKPKGELYGGWEARGIAGHTLGHYLTALAQQYAATGDRRFRERLDYIIAEMAECQRAYGDGYIGALPPKELATLRGFKDGHLELQGAFNFQGGAWVPWYTEHKILAGLKDAWLVGGNAQAKDVTIRLANWIDTVTNGLTPDQLQAMLQVEHGGMIETLVDLYAHTGDPRYLATSKRFYHRAILDPLLAGRDELPGKHANTQIPKVIGEARTYEITGDPNGRKIAENFWNLVVHHHSWAIGGNSDHEHFFPENQAGGHLGPATAETCNTYNMLKLTEHLFEWQPSVAYADYYERALYNQILPSQEPKKGMFTYFVSLEPGHFKTYSTPFDSFWCCVGTGMENHTKYGEAIYFHTADTLTINLFIPSVLTWPKTGLVLEQRTAYPRADTSEITINSPPANGKALTLEIRCPAWATAPLRFELNGQPLSVEAKPGTFARIARVWKKSDHLRVAIPMGLHTEALAGAPDRIAFLYGPLVLAGDLGPVPTTASFPYAKNQSDNFHAPSVAVPALVTDDPAHLLASIHRVPGEDLAFRTVDLGRPGDITLRPFGDIAYDYYNIYWTVLTPAAWQARQATTAKPSDDARIVDEFAPGEQQSEVDHHLAAERSETGDFRDRKWRDARDGGYFSFTLKVRPRTAQILRCTYWGDDAGTRAFDILLDGKLLATEQLHRSHPGEFFVRDMPLPAALLEGKATVTIRFHPHLGNIAGGLFGAAILTATK